MEWPRRMQNTAGKNPQTIPTRSTIKMNHDFTNSFRHVAAFVQFVKDVENVPDFDPKELTEDLPRYISNFLIYNLGDKEMRNSEGELLNCRDRSVQPGKIAFLLSVSLL